MTAPVTLDTCAREPIHIPGSIQPHGMLFACRGAQLVVEQLSANAATWLARELAGLIGSSFLDLLAPAARAELEHVAAHAPLREPDLVRVQLANGAPLDARVHRSDDLVVIELEPIGPPAAANVRGFDPRTRDSIRAMQGALTVTELCQTAARQVRAVTGFDRVMVYRFDAAWNGTIVAEEKRADLEPFLGLHYPASDIPEQARRLYTINWLRSIVDVAYTPVPIVSGLNAPTPAPLDLSQAVLRSVSPIHIEYLKNMGVAASMSVSLVADGVLIGLIACHHYSGPRWIAPVGRETSEFLARALSWQLKVLAAADRAERDRMTQRHEAEIARSLVTSKEVLDGLGCPSLLALTQADGAAIVLDEGTRCLGAGLSDAQLVELIGFVRDRGEDAYATHHLAADLPGAAGWDIAGVIAVAVSRELGEYLFWFRRPTAQTVDWAGDPRKLAVVEVTGEPARLSPRGSFALWREIVRGQSLPWEVWHVAAASQLRRLLLGGIRKRAVEFRQLNARLVEADRAKDDFIATVGHELRTPLSAISGWIHLLRANEVSPDRTAHALEVIARNAEAQGQIIDDLLDISRVTSGKMSLEIAAVDLPTVVQSVLDGLTLALGAKALKLKRIIEPDAGPIMGDTVRLRQIIGNLLGNAVKFTDKGGTVTVILHRHESDVQLVITDTGRGIAPAFLPHVFEAFRQDDSGMNRRTQGLGLGLAIVRKLVELHGGTIQADSDGEGRGASFTVRLPLLAVSARVHREVVDPRPDDAPALDGLRVLIVEDDTDSRELLHQILTSRGAIVIAAADGPAALQCLIDHRVDLVVSDIGLPGMNGLELIRAIRAQHAELGAVPAIALSAYTRAVDRTRALQAGFAAHVPKPVDPTELVTVIASVAGRLGPRP